MQNFMKIIISAIQTWTKGKIKESTADWNQNDSNADNYVKNRTHWEEIVEELYLLKDFVPNATGNIDTGISHTFTIGDIYKVIYNGVVYDNLIAEHWEDEYYGIGAMWGDYTIYPFGLDSSDNENVHVHSSDPSATITLIQKNVRIFHKLDSRYLDIPDDIATIVDVDDVKSLMLSNVDSKLGKLNPSGSGTFSLNRKNGTNIGTHSVAIGYKTTASGQYSYAEGNITQATNDATATTTKYSGAVVGYTTHAEGYGTVACGAVSHAEGNGTKASGTNSHAEGESTTASGYATHAEGYYTRASGSVSHAEGYQTTSSGGNSHAEGRDTTASGNNSHAEGYQTTASGANSHAEGYQTTASGKDSCVQGSFNIVDNSNIDRKTGKRKYAHIIGNGTSDSERSNAHTLDWGGVGWFQGGLQVGGNAQDDGARNVLLDGDAVPVPESAVVGQVVAVKAVDENSKPTEWECVDPFMLTDSKTGVKYKLYVYDGKLTMAAIT